MNALLIENINKTAPYEVTLSKDGIAYDFFTHYGVHYSITFLYEDTLLEEETYQFIIANINNKKSPNNNRVKDTILAIVEEFFRQNNTVLLYICEAGDEKQSMRNRLFERWFTAYGRRALFTCLSSSIVDEDGITNYAH